MVECWLTWSWAGHGRNHNSLSSCVWCPCHVQKTQIHTGSLSFLTLTIFLPPLWCALSLVGQRIIEMSVGDWGHHRSSFSALRQLVRLRVISHTSSKNQRFWIAAFTSVYVSNSSLKSRLRKSHRGGLKAGTWYTCVCSLVHERWGKLPFPDQSHISHSAPCSCWLLFQPVKDMHGRRIRQSVCTFYLGSSLFTRIQKELGGLGVGRRWVVF